MKFRFCGELDCPDWVLAQIALLSKLTSIKLRILSQLATNRILGQELEEAKARKAVADLGVDDDSILKPILAALEFIIQSAVKYACDVESLNSELQQLGLPKEHSTQLCRIYENKREQLTLYLEGRSYKIESASVTGEVHPIHKDDKAKSFVVLSLSQGDQKHSVAMSAGKLKLLTTELQQAQALMKLYEKH